jgi:hypothetical protein
MSRNFYGDLEQEKYSQRLNPLRMPIDLTVPETIAETMPRSQLRLIRGKFLLRFFPLLPPAIGHTIRYKGHRWLIVAIEHPVQISNSPNHDQFPIVETEYLGAV